MSLWRRWEKLGDFGRGLSLAGVVASLTVAVTSLPAPLELLPALEAATEAPLLEAPAPHLSAPTISAAPDRVATLERGETLSQLLQDVGLDGADAQAAASAASRYLNPRQLRPGLTVAAFREGTVTERLQLAVAGKGELTVRRGEESWLPDWRPYAREVRTRVVRGSLSGSLEKSLVGAGADAELAYAMADVLQWDLDFARDLQNGDTFEALFEEVYLEGDYFGVGRVLALTYAQERRRYEVYRFGEGESFYDADGRPLEKMFLRAPLPYSRVTSKFSMRRFHPVLKVARPHYGVDYGAPVGTPVRVTASGTVVSAGWDGGGGKTVKVRHANGYLTGYLHLSRFADGVRAGARVRQGELIGYVGSTGLASGPHLDYRVQLNGRWIDPQSLKSVPAEPLSRLARADFERERDAMRLALAGEDAYRPSPRGAPELPSTQLASASAASSAAPAPTKK